MMDALEHIGTVIRGLITRVVITDTKIAGRTMVQFTGLDGQAQQAVELLHPPGRSSRPTPGTDALLLNVNGNADHVVALGGDTVGVAIADLAPGEFGDNDGNTRVVFRSGHYEITTTLNVQLTSTGQVSLTTPTVQTSENLVVGTGASGTIVDTNGRVVTVRDGIIVNIK